MNSKRLFFNFLPARHPVVWLLLIGFFVRLLVLNRLSGSPYFKPDGGDMKFYSDWALQILRGHWTDGKAFYGLPGYAFLLAGIDWITAGYVPEASDLLFVFSWVTGLFQAVTEACVAVILYKIAVLVFDETGTEMPGKMIGWGAALGWIFFQPAQTFSSVLMPTPWLVLAFWGCVWWILSTRTSSWWNPWLWMGLLIGAIAMMIATVLFLVPLAAVAACLSVDPTRPVRARIPRVVLAWVCLIGGIYIGASPCWIHNYFVAHEPVMLSAHSGLNFYIGNNPIANGYPKIPPGMRAGQQGMLKDSITMAELAAGHPMKRADVSKFWSAKAGNYIHNQFPDWLRLMGLKLRNFWNAYQYDDLSLVTLFSEDGILTPGLRFGFVAALAIPGMFFCGWKFRRSRWVIAAVLLHMSALLPVFITERYRMAAIPGLLLLMFGGLWGLWTFLCSGKWLQASAYLAVATAAAVFVSWPNPDGSLYALDYYNTGIKDIDSGKLERAEKNLTIAYRYVPDNAEFNFALGNLWLKKEDRTRANYFFRRAIELNPRHASAYNNLGVLAMEEKRWVLAAKFLEAAVVIEPEDAKAHYLLGKVK
ncbi:MAG: tetratricopeptide repeat protein, partial [Verrucomicrobiota bacterium]